MSLIRRLSQICNATARKRRIGFGGPLYCDIRIRALASWDDDLVLTRWAAARLTFWPDLPVAMITAALPRKRTAPPGFELVQETIPRPLVRTVDGGRVTAPELTALDHALTDRGTADPGRPRPSL